MADKHVLEQLWMPAEPVWETLRGWKHPRKRGFSELNADDRKKLLSACLALVMLDDHAAHFVHRKIVGGLPEDLSAEVYHHLGLSAFTHAAESPSKTYSLLAIDLITMYIEREMDRNPRDGDLTELLDEPVLQAVRDRQYQFGITCPDSPFKRWKPAERERMAKPLFDLVWRGMALREDAEHIASVAAADDAIKRTFHHQQKVSKHLEEDVRAAIGEYVFTLARKPPDVADEAKPRKHSFGLERIPDAAIPFVFTYIARRTEESGGKVDELFGQLDERLARALMDAWTEQEEEATAEPSAD